MKSYLAANGFPVMSYVSPLPVSQLLDFEAVNFARVWIFVCSTSSFGPWPIVARPEEQTADRFVNYNFQTSHLLQSVITWF